MAVLALAACAPTYPITPPPSAPPAAAAPARPAPDIPPRTPAPTPERPGGDACGAASMQRLVGRPRSEIPVPVDPARQRVACTSCPVTQDYNPARLNFFFDAQTGVVREVRCG